MTKAWSGTLEVEMIEDQEDGSAIVSILCDKNFNSFICYLGFNFLMACAASGITVDEAYERILKNE
jgi:hypothetical protein